MKKYFILLGVLLITLFFSRSSFASTTQVDALIEKLIEKNILTVEEGRDLKGEIAADEKTSKEGGLTQGLPSWVQDMKLKGDFRVRHEYSKRNDSTDQERNRGRIRYRLGIETKVNDKVKVGAGLASDGGTPRSTNRTFTDAFAKASVNLDYAYAEYTPFEYLTLQGGKMPKMPFWEPADLLWDTDLTPEGAAAILNYKVNDSTSIFGTIAPLVLDEITTDTSDPFLLVAQGGLGFKYGEKADAMVAATWYAFENGGKELLDSRSSPATNTVTGGRYDFSYDSIEIGTELGWNDPLSNLLPVTVHRVALIGQFIHNPDPSDDNNGWLAGAYFGDKKVGGQGQWKVTGAYRYLGKDAWYDSFPDGDFYGGATDVRGFKGALEIGLAKNVSFGINYYQTERIIAAKAQEVVIQSDLNFKF